MPVAKDFHGVVSGSGPAILLARIVGADGAPIQTADIAGAEYSVLEVDACDHNSSTVVEGHNQVAISTQQALFDALQTDSLWNADPVGYNFKHELDTPTNEAFPQVGRLYQVRYVLTPYSGQRIVFRFSLRAI